MLSGGGTGGEFHAQDCMQNRWVFLQNAPDFRTV